MRFFLVVLACVPCDARGLSFLAMGDWGGDDASPYTQPGQAKAAIAMRQVASDVGASFAIGLGDNFYTDGIHSDEHDARFAESFENVYTSKSLQIPFYMIAGNVRRAAAAPRATPSLRTRSLHTPSHHFHHHCRCRRRCCRDISLDLHPSVRSTTTVGM